MANYFVNRINYWHIIMCFLTCFNSPFYGQLTLEDISLDKILQKTSRKYINDLIKENKHQFSDIHPSWISENDTSTHNKNEMTFFLNGNIQDIWNTYLSANPSKSWNSNRVSFTLLLRKIPSAIFYEHDIINGIDTGQVFFLSLKFLFGIIRLPVAFEMIKIDPVNKIIEFSYIEGNKSSGKQQIKFIELESKLTKIVHTSYFKSDSQFRDKYLYPVFHKKLVKDFHKNMSELLNVALLQGIKVQ